MNTNWYTISVNQDGNHRNIISNWAGVIAFLRLNISRDEQREIGEWVSESFTQGYPLVGWQWANGDSFEIYCPANESLPTTVSAPVVVNPLRKMVNVVTAIL